MNTLIKAPAQGWILYEESPKRLFHLETGGWRTASGYRQAGMSWGIRSEFRTDTYILNFQKNTGFRIGSTLLEQTVWRITSRSWKAGISGGIWSIGAHPEGGAAYGQIVIKMIAYKMYRDLILDRIVLRSHTQIKIIKIFWMKPTWTVTFMLFCCLRV